MNGVDIVYIAGAGRSGSSILDRVPGTLPGVVCCNELRPVWRAGFHDDLPCACGQSFRAGPFWGRVYGSWPQYEDIARTPRATPGSVQRFSAGTARIRLDDEWRTRLPPRTRALGTLLGFPLSAQHGYLGDAAPTSVAAG
jgi:hypothetical protein